MDDVDAIGQVIAAWQADPERSPNIAHVRSEPERAAAYDDLDVHESVGKRLNELGIDRVYGHQARAIEAIRSGGDTVVVSGTASGKSLTYQIPIAEAVAADETATALLLFPTKALGRDQLQGLTRLLGTDVGVAVYDGDTDPRERKWVREKARVVLTNPDMLHVGILPNHRGWLRFLGGLRYVVVDEMHTLRGVFGSHVANVLARLRRLAAHHGSRPTLVFTSATIGNPGGLATWLAGRPVAVSAGDDAPRGPRRYVLWNPPMTDEEDGTRPSPLNEATSVFVDLVGADVSSLLFTRSRKSTELTYRWASERLGQERAARIAPYRSGYLPEQRRRVERGLSSGEIVGVTATNALELGIDIGGLDAVVATGFPGTIASFRQQSGRAGRGERESLTVLVAGEDALDQYYMTHVDDLFERSAEAVIVNPANPAIRDGHILCAAHELDLSPGDREYFSEDFEEVVNRLVQEDRLVLRDGRVFSGAGKSPATSIGLRSSGGRPYLIATEDGELLGELDEDRAFSQCHEGAVYLHLGETYVVRKLDTELREVRVVSAEPGYYTQPKVEKDLVIHRTIASKRVGGLRAHHGIVDVESHVIGFRKKSTSTGEIIDTLPLDLPPRTLRTQAFWYEIPETDLAAISADLNEAAGTMHAVEHAAIGLLPIFAVCDRWDVGGLSTVFHAQAGGPVFFIYDGYEGGTGIAPIGWEMGAQHLTATLVALETCPCRSGCPSCVQSPKCGNFNDPLNKAGAITLLRGFSR
jgi:DEAD/DEAH box helicase domain-containing protein